MCWLCTRHGAGKKYFQNLANYADELMDIPEVLSASEAYLINSSTPERKASTRDLLGRLVDPDPEVRAEARSAFSWWTGSPGDYSSPQVLSMEEQREVLGTMVGQVGAGKVGVMGCICRRNYRGIADHKVCFMFGRHLEQTMRRNTEYTFGMDEYTPEGALALAEDIHMKGYVPIMFQHYVGYIDPPVGLIYAICHCDYPNCYALHYRLDLGVPEVMKGHSVAKVNYNKCNPARCNMECCTYCQFRAIVWSASYTWPYINMRLCFGCGQCKDHCPAGAIELVERDSIPVLKWSDENYGGW